MLLSSEVGKESFCMTHQKSQDQMTEIFELSIHEFIKGSKELAIATSFSLKCPKVGSLGRTCWAPLWLITMLLTQEEGQGLPSGSGPPPPVLRASPPEVSLWDYGDEALKAHL